MPDPRPSSPPSEPAFPSVASEAFDGNGWAITLAGPCDLLVLDDLRRAVAAGVAHGHRHLVVDLRDATLLGCAAIGVLVRGLAPLRDEPAAAVALVVRGGGLVARMLSALELDACFDVVPDRAAAERLVRDPRRRRREGWRRLATQAASPG